MKIEKFILAAAGISPLTVTAEQHVIHLPNDGPVTEQLPLIKIKQCTLRLAYGKSPATLTRKGAESSTVTVTDIGEQF